MNPATAMKALVIGYGSIGQRHTRLLVELGCDVAVMSRRTTSVVPYYSNLEKAIAHWQPGYVVVANRTSEHFQTIEALARFGYQGNLLVEKPLFHCPINPPLEKFAHTVVGYNLRCHPLIERLKVLLQDSPNLITASIYAGSYLPDWRPNSDYRQSYSSQNGAGGGALRDLSHEIDYALWLLGPWQRLTASGGHLSSLDIDSDDAYSILMEVERCPLVSIQMNYVERVPRREISVNTDHLTIRADLIKNTLKINGVKETFTITRDATYRAQHQAILTGKTKMLCTWSDAMETLLAIQAAEQAAQSHIWINR